VSNCNKIMFKNAFFSKHYSSRPRKFRENLAKTKNFHETNLRGSGGIEVSGFYETKFRELLRKPGHFRIIFAKI
jgi:hypothetical protein